jgi:hypothetical protein
MPSAAVQDRRSLAQLFVLVKQNNSIKELLKRKLGIYEIAQPSLPPGAYNFKFVDRTFSNEALEYNIDATLLRPVKPSSRKAKRPDVCSTTDTRYGYLKSEFMVGDFGSFKLGVFFDDRCSLDWVL